MKFVVSPWLTTEIVEKTKEYILRLNQGESAEEVAVSIYQSLGKSEAISRMMIIRYNDSCLLFRVELKSSPNHHF